MKRVKMRLTTVAIVVLSAFLPSCSSDLTEQAIPPVQLQQLQTEWQLINLDGLAIEATSSLRIDAQARATGNLACNNFFGSVELKTQKLRINKMGNTRKQCRSELNTIEITVGSTLSNWSEVKIIDQQLILTGAKHTLIYRMK